MPILIPEPHDPVLFRADGKRLDGRAVDELRPFSCKVGVLKNAQGSAFVQHGGNKIYAAVYGPREVHPRHMARSDKGILRVYYRMSTFSVHERKSPAPNRREIEISKVIREALEPVLFLEAYPDSAIEVFVEVVAADGGTRCASTTASALALADAGIPMRSMVVGVAAGKAQGKVVLDSNDKEDKVGDADLPVAVIIKDKSISLLQFDGIMTPEELELALKYIQKGAVEIYSQQMVALKSKYDAIRERAEQEDKQIKEEMPQGVPSEIIPDEVELVEGEEKKEEETGDTNQDYADAFKEDDKTPI
jgi:exosome complex component RRP41